MPTPDFIVSLRGKIGQDLLWLSGVTAVVVRDHDGAVLMARRADNGAWTPVTGIIDPGEAPAEAARRELLEEAGVVGEAVRLASVTVTHPVTYPNGDVSQYIDLCFRFRWISGEPEPLDGENSEVRWFAVSELAGLGISEHHQANIARALEGGESGPAFFEV